MSIYTIGDLHLSFGMNKPMDIFGVNWEGHFKKIEKSWKEQVTEKDLVVLPGDFSWAMNLNDTIEDFKYLSKLPGKKILLKGNHDYWWATLKKMRQFIKDNEFGDIDFLQNNSYLYEDKIIVGTRGWVYDEKGDNIKILKREKLRLELSLQDAVEKYGDEKEIIVFMHYPPFGKEYVLKENDLKESLKQYNVKKCIYGHLHGESCQDAIQGELDGIEYILVSSDYLEFNLKRID